MKNISLFQVLVIIFFAFAANNSARCHEESGYGFAAGPQFGILYGQVLELVYPNNTKAELLSELIWEMKPVFYSGAILDFGLKDVYSRAGFFSSISYKIGIGGDSGKMEDRDWMSRENAELTHFSSHTNKTTEFFWLEITAGASLPVKSHFYIKPLLSFSWIRYSFMARDGYTKYARPKGDGTYYPIDDAPKIEDKSGEDVCNYLQDWLMGTAGFIAGTRVFYPFLIDLSFKISPLTFTGSIDEHLLREETLTFLDFTRFGLFIEPGARFSFSYKKLEFSLDFSYHYNSNTRGETYINSGDSDKYYIINNEAGAGFSLFDTRVILRISI